MKKVDERKITATEIMLIQQANQNFDTKRRKLAIGNYYDWKGNTFLKATPSCIEAGYSQTYAENYGKRVLGLDSLTDRDHPVWKKLTGDIVLSEEMFNNWLVAHKDNPETKDVRLLPHFWRVWGDKIGAFIKREEKITHNIDEKRAVIIYATSEAHLKAIDEKIAVLQSQRAQIDVESKESG